MRTSQNSQKTPVPENTPPHELELTKDTVATTLFSGAPTENVDGLGTMLIVGAPAWSTGRSVVLSLDTQAWAGSKLTSDADAHTLVVGERRDAIVGDAQCHLQVAPIFASCRDGQLVSTGDGEHTGVESARN